MIGLGFIRWMRRVLPRGDLVTAAVLILMLIDLLHLFTRWWFGFADENLFRLMRFLWATACASAYGQYRVIAFHPAFNLEYKRWLESTPWTSENPLPNGPLQLVPQDLVVVFAMSLMLHEWSLSMLYIPTAFLFGYQLTLAVIARIIGHWGLAYSIGFFLGAVILFIQRPEVSFAAADGCFIIGRFTVNHALRTFPWTMPWQFEIRSIKAFGEEAKRRRLGWPYDQLAPKVPEPVVPLHDGICLSLLVGWWWFVSLAIMPPEARVLTITTSFIGMFVVGIFRLTHYVNSHQSPISFFGRIFTLRWIIPSYDVVFIGPLLAFVGNLIFQTSALLLLAPGMVNANPWPGIMISTSGMIVASISILIVGPNLERWRMAARHRIVFDLAATEKLGKADQFIEL